MLTKGDIGLVRGATSDSDTPSKLGSIRMHDLIRIMQLPIHIPNV